MISAFSTFSMMEQARQLTQKRIGRPLGYNDKFVMNPDPHSNGTVGPNAVPAGTGAGFRSTLPNPSAGSNVNLGSIGGAINIMTQDNGGAFSPNIYSGGKFANNANSTSAFTSSPMGGALMLERDKPVELSQQRPIDTSAYAPVKYSGGLV